MACIMHDYPVIKLVILLLLVGTGSSTLKSDDQLDNLLEVILDRRVSTLEKKSGKGAIIF